MSLRKIAAWASERIASLGISVIAVVIALAVPIRAQLNAPQTFGATGGTTSAITVSLHNVSALSDILWVPIRFVPSGANPGGGTTLAIVLDSGGPLGPLAIEKQTQTSGGLTALVGNEFQAGQVATVMYDGTEFQCLTCTPVTPAGVENDYDGINVPAGWLLANGSAQSRSTFSVLFNALNLTSVAAVTINANATVSVPNSALFQVGWYVGGPNVNCNAQISSIPDGTHITLSSTATNGGSTTLSIGPNQQGDCSTTFNLPNRTGRITAGVDGSTNITSAGCPNNVGTAATLGFACGGQTQTLTASQIPSINVTVSLGASANAPTTNNSIQSNVVTPSGGTAIATSASAWGQFNSMSGASTNTGGNPHPILPPIALVYKIIKT